MSEMSCRDAGGAQYWSAFHQACPRINPHSYHTEASTVAEIIQDAKLKTAIIPFFPFTVNVRLIFPKC